MQRINEWLGVLFLFSGATAAFGCGDGSDDSWSEQTTIAAGGVWERAGNVASSGGAAGTAAAGTATTGSIATLARPPRAVRLPSPLRVPVVGSNGSARQREAY